MTREEFIKQRMKIDKVSRKYFEKNYIVVECNCGKSYCNGWRCLIKDDIDADLFDYVKELEQQKNKAIKYINCITWSDGCIDCEPEQTKKLLSILQDEEVIENEI